MDAPFAAMSPQPHPQSPNSPMAQLSGQLAGVHLNNGAAGNNGQARANGMETESRFVPAPVPPPSLKRPATESSSNLSQPSKNPPSSPSATYSQLRTLLSHSIALSSANKREVGGNQAHTLAAHLAAQDGVGKLQGRVMSTPGVLGGFERRQNEVVGNWVLGKVSFVAKGIGVKERQWISRAAIKVAAYFKT